MSVKSAPSAYAMLLIGPTRPISWPLLAALAIAFVSWRWVTGLDLGACMALALLWFGMALVYGYRAQRGLLPAMRLLLLSAPGITGGMIYWLSSGSMFITRYAGDWLDVAFVKEFAMASAVAGLASCVGDMLGARKPPAAWTWLRRPVSPSLARAISAISLLVGVLALLDMAGGAKPIFLTGSYNATITTVQAPPVVGVVNSVGVFLVFVSFLGLHRQGRQWRVPSWYWWCVVILVYGYLAAVGLRQDALVPFGLLVLFAWLLRRWKLPVRPMVMGAGMLLLGYLASIVTGQLRASFSWETLVGFVQEPTKAFFLTNALGEQAVLMDAITSVSGTFLAVFLKTAAGTAHLLGGSSYLDFIPRTPPEFLYPGRPQDLAWQMGYEGVLLASGGILEIAEAYWNFARIGIVAVPLVISYLLVRLSLSVCDAPNPLLGALPLALLSTMPRWVLYQTFALYKGALAMAFAGLAIWLVARILTGAARPVLWHRRGIPDAGLGGSGL